MTQMTGRHRAARTRLQWSGATRRQQITVLMTAAAVVVGLAQAVTAPSSSGLTNNPPDPNLGPTVAGQAASWTAARTSPSATSGGTTTPYTAGPVNPNGTGAWGATPLSPASAWQVSGQTGSFTWSYPFTAIPAAAGPTPALGLSYDSSSVDGETGATNNQPTVVGEGWALAGAGSIDRAYVACPADHNGSGPATGDMCWSSDNASLTLAGHSGPLVRVSTTNTWKLRNDDGTVVTYSNPGGTSRDGDYWKVTTPDGTQYFYGRNIIPGGTTPNSRWTVPVFGNDTGEPCHAATYSASMCQQAWRWNLDYVVDPHGNAEAFYYNNPETNNYASNNGTGGVLNYIRGGTLDHVDYGIAPGASPTTAPLRIQLTYVERCVSGVGCSSQSPTPSDYPDTPWADQCNSGSCTGQTSPTFFTSKMLSYVEAQLVSGGNTTKVQGWSLAHTFPDPGDNLNPALWLQSITRTGADGTPMPQTVFSGIPLQNRVLHTADGMPTFFKYRISWILTEAGALTNVAWDDPTDQSSDVDAATTYGCQSTQHAVSDTTNPSTNHLLCFPQWWVPPTSGGVTPTPEQDWFNKYVVVRVDTVSMAGKAVINGVTDLQGPQTHLVTHYQYTGAPSWRYNTSPLLPDTQRSWTDFAGFKSVRVVNGPLTTPEGVVTTLYYQGMYHDRTCADPPACTSPGIPNGAQITDSTGTSVNDDLQLAGWPRETTATRGIGGPTITDTIATPWNGVVTADDGINKAQYVSDGTTKTVTPTFNLDGTGTGASRTAQIVKTYDDSSRLIKISDLGDTGTATDDRCTTIDYPTTAQNGLLAYPIESRTVAATCGTTPSLPADAISDIQYFYDGQGFGTGPIKGEVSQAQTPNSYSGGVVHDWRVTTTSYDSLGRPTLTTDPMGRTNRTVYTPAANSPLTQTVTTNPLGWTTTTTLDGRFGVPTSVVDVNTKTTTMTYDGFGRRKKVWATDRPQASFPNSPTTSYDYTVIQNGANAVSTTSLTPYGTATSYQLTDGLGRPIQTQTPAEGGGTDYVDTAYDTAGKVSRTTSAYWNSTAPSATLFLPTTAETLPNYDQFAYDGAGRQTTDKHIGGDPANPVWTSTTIYGGDRVTTIPPTGAAATTTVTDARGNATSLIQYLGNPATVGVGTQPTSYTYDGAGRMASMTDPAGNRWTWTHDIHGNVTASTDPDRGATSSVFDTGDRMTSSTDATGATLSYGYDTLDRKTSVDLTTGGTTARQAAWVYDGLVKGQLSSSTRYVGATGTTQGTLGAAYIQSIAGYDAAYRPTGTDTSIPSSPSSALSGVWSTRTYYLQDGSIDNQQEPTVAGLTAETLHYRYTSLGRLLAVNTGGTSIVAKASYSHLGELAQYTQGEGTVINKSFVYDSHTGRLANALTLVGMTGNQAYNAVSNTTYSYDHAGNVTSVANLPIPGYPNAIATDRQCYSYDPLAELTTAWTAAASNACDTTPASASDIGGPAPYWTNWTYDAVGNRSTQKDNLTGVIDTYHYPAAGQSQPHTLTSVTHSTGPTDSYGYNALGQTTSRPGQTLTWTADGRVAGVTAGSQTDSRIYTADGTLLIETDASWTSLHLGNTVVLAPAGATSASQLLINRFYKAFGQTQAQHNASSTTSGTSFFDANPQDTPSLTLYAAPGPNPVILGSRYNTPFGGTRGTTGSWPNNRTFLGQPTDRTSGLRILGARDYDSATGRFLSSDPILDTGDPQQTNGYSYASNNPVTRSDPTGLLSVDQNGDQLVPGQKSAPTYAPSGQQNLPSGSAPIAATSQGGTSSSPAQVDLSGWGVIAPTFGTCTCNDLATHGIPITPGEGLDNRKSKESPPWGLILPLVEQLGVFALPEIAAGARAADVVAEAADASDVTDSATAAGRTIERVQQDISVNPNAPRELPLNRAISRSQTQNDELQARIEELRAQGATRFRVNQQQVDINDVRVGINRPDLQYTLNGQRFYEEYETGSIEDAWAHMPRILANDPSGQFIPWFIR